MQEFAKRVAKILKPYTLERTRSTAQYPVFKDTLVNYAKKLLPEELLFNQKRKNFAPENALHLLTKH